MTLELVDRYSQVWNSKIFYIWQSPRRPLRRRVVLHTRVAALSQEAEQEEDLKNEEEKRRKVEKKREKKKIDKQQQSLS